MNTEEVTIEKLNSFTYPEEAINWAEDLLLTAGPRPHRPQVPYNSTSAEAKAFYEAMVEYEGQMEIWNREKEVRNTHNQQIRNCILEYIKETAMLNTVPEQYRANVNNLAWEEGHHAGYTEYMNRLSTLVSNIFR